MIGIGTKNFSQARLAIFLIDSIIFRNRNASYEPRFVNKGAKIRKGVHFLRLVESGKVNVHGRDSDGRRPVQHLLDLEEPVRWRFAEILLSAEINENEHDAGAWGYNKLFIYTDPLLYAEREYRNHIAHYIMGKCMPSRVSRLAHDTGCGYGDLATMDATLQGIQQCVVRVVTKLLIENRYPPTQNWSRNWR